MKNRKLFFFVALMVMAAFLVVGCSSGSESEKKTTTTTEEKKEAAVETKSIVEQVKESWHYKFFPEMIAKGPDIKKPDGEHYNDNCMKCHSAVKILDDPNAKVDDFFPGGKYAGKDEGITCRVCHKFEGKEMVTLRYTGWDACGVCHTSSGGKLPALGGEVHHPQLQMIKGVGIGEVPDMPSYKYKQGNFACYDCHITNAFKHDFMVPGVKVEHNGFARSKVTMDYEKFKEVFKQKKCEGCHSGNADQIASDLKKHQEEIGGKLEELKKVYDELSKKYAAAIEGKTLDQVTDPKAKAFMEGRTYFTYVEADASRGAHNYELAKALLEKAEAKFNAAK